MAIEKAICGEYLTGYITHEKRVLINKWVMNYAAVQCVDVGLTNIVDGIGGQYDIMVLDSKGDVTVIMVDNTLSIIKIPSPVKNVTKIFNCFQSYFCYSNNVMYQWGANLWNLGTSNTKAVALTMPAGKVFVHFSGSCSTNLNDLTLYGLASDGTVWQWRGKTPTQVPMNNKVVSKFTTCGHFAIVAHTTDNDLLACGGINPEILGLPWNLKTPTSIKKKFTDVGAVFPLKQIIGNYSTLHVIDANDHHFAIGNQINGEVGFGPIKDYVKGDKSYHWDWSERMLQPVRQIPGKWKELFSSPTITFYWYGLKLNGNLFSWGRNKSLSLGNGVTLPAFDSQNRGYDKRPNGLDMPAPSYVDPENTLWNIIKNFDVNNPPIQVPVPEPNTPTIIISAGKDIETTAKRVQITGSVEGKYKAVKWSVIKKPEGVTLFSIEKDNTLTPSLITMQLGEFVLRMTVTDENDKTHIDDCVIKVISGVWNPAPIKEVGKIVLGGKQWIFFDNGQYTGEKTNGSIDLPEVKGVINIDGTWAKK